MSAWAAYAALAVAVVEGAVLIGARALPAAHVARMLLPGLCLLACLCLSVAHLNLAALAALTAAGMAHVADLAQHLRDRRG